MSDWIAFNDPYFTDAEPYCNTVRFIKVVDAISYMKRVWPERDYTDLTALNDFMATHWAWEVEEPNLRTYLKEGYPT